MVSTTICPSCQRAAPVDVDRCDCGSLLRCPQCGWRASEVVQAERRCFGDYLVKKGAISDGQLVAALDAQAGQQEHFGHIAVRHGMLTPNQLLAVLNAQLVNRARFGEVAVELGYLTREQVDEVLAIQRRGRPPLGEVLVSMGVMAQREVDRHLPAYQGESAAAPAKEVSHA
jgi:hypothetical protein